MLISAVVIALFSLLNTQPALAQNAGRLKGKVTDKTGNPIAHAQIIIRRAIDKYKVEADERGNYQIRLPAGEYQVIIEERPGFAEYRRDKVLVESGGSTVFNITPDSRIYYEDCDKGLLNP